MGSVLSGESDWRRRGAARERELLREEVATREEELREARRAAAAREEAWEAERRERDEEAARLRRRLKEEKATVSGGEEEEEEEEAAAVRPEEVAGKWKQLYVAIKTELDELIQRTPLGERFYFGSERDIIEQLQKELKAKEDTMETLKLRIEAMEQEASKRDREIDILKQSLRILSNKKKSRVGTVRKKQ